MVTSYLDILFHGLMGGIKYAFLGFIIGVVILILLRKFNLLKREGAFLNFFTKLYYVIIPLSLGGIFWVGGSVASLQADATTEVDKLLKVAETEMVPTFVHFLESEIDTLMMNGQVPTNQEITDRFKALNHEYAGGSAIADQVLDFTLNTVLEYIIGKDEEHEQRLKKLSGDIGPEVVHSAFNTVRGVIRTQVKNFINTFVTPIFAPILFPSVFFLLIPMGEIIWFVSRRAKEGATE